MTVPPPLRPLLWPASVIYGAIAATRAKLYASGTLKQKRLQTAVISVGNLSVGGTGKTPFVIWLAEKLLQQGKRVAILTRGYRGTAGTSDEVELMRSRLQNRVFFGVGPDRYAQGHALESQHPIDVFILDDGFQHLQLARDLDIVLLDASTEVGADFLLPAGPLREPLSALNRADALVLTRVENGNDAQKRTASLNRLPAFTAFTVLHGFQRLGGNDFLPSRNDIGAGPFFAFCGIGNPKAFVRDLIRWKIVPVGRQFFADHHRYTPNNAQAVERLAVEAGAKVLVTTEKDFWNLREVKFPTLPVFAAIIDLQIDGEPEFLNLVDTALQARGAHT